MRKQTINFFCTALAVLLAARFAQAFSPIGPGAGGGTGGDAWQQPVIGYGLNPGPDGVDLGTPKNLGEDYRRVTPVMYYASDASFINFFGTAGLTNIDSAFAIMNGVLCGQTNTPLFLNSPTNGILSSYNNPYAGVPWTLSGNCTLDAYSPGLGDFPLESQLLNYTAQAAGLYDLRSTTLGQLMEQIGLTEPERYVWALHDRYLPPGGKCPGDEEYLVVQRNFDIINSPLNQVQYSPYVNGTLYDFEIEQVCGSPYLYLPGDLAIAVPVPVDQFADSYTAVASDELSLGGYYVSLTRDDVAGMRYLMSSNTINYEATAPSGGLLVVTNTQSPQTFGPTLPISLLLSQALTNDPATLQANYPGITFLSVTTNIVNAVTTNITAYFTNLAAPYTNHVAFSNNMAVYPTNGTIPFTNWSPVQFDNSPQQLTTLPLAPLLLLAQTLDPATLESIYPGLLVGSVTTNYLSAVISTNLSIFLTNQSVLPVFSNTVSGGLPNVTHLTNIFFFTNQPGPTVINYDVTQPYTTISTLDLANFSDFSQTNPPATMQALYPALQILRATTSPAFVPVTNYISYLTNYNGSPYQGSPKLVTLPVSTNYVWVTNWHYVFGNVFTNHFYTNRFVTVQSIWITNLTGAPYGSPFIAKTNTVTYKTNLISGDFFLIPTNWCGFDLSLAFPLGNPPYSYGVTNTVVYAGYNTNGAAGTNATVGGNTYGLTQNFSDLYTNYNYAVYPGICEPVLAFGTNYSTNIVNQYQYGFLNVVTNHYFTNALVSLFVTNVFYIPGGSPDMLGTNVSTSSFYTNLPSGDFYLVPTNWCGYQINALLTNAVVSGIVLTNQTFSSGTVTSAQYTVVQYLTYTNYTYSIRPGHCEPAVAIVTNFTTNIVSQYGYYFGNIVTNHYFTNGPIIVVTTNDAVWTNGLVGMVTNIVTTNVINTGIGGDFYIVPPADCAFTILATQLMNIVTSTNTFTATNLTGLPLLTGEQYVQTIYSSYTNSIFLVQQSTCGTATPPPALRQGIGRVEFIRANYDSLLGQFFQPITNYYTMVMVTNSQRVTEYYQRVITTPDFLMRAQDLSTGPSAIPAVAALTRNLNFDQSQVPAGLAGPGTIIPSTTITYNEVGNIYDNGSLNTYALATNSFLTSLTQGSSSVIAWASFDNSTNDPVVYPSGTSIANLVNQLFIQVTPSTVADGTNGVAYPPTVFTAAGGQSPYTWAAPNFAVPGMSFNASTQTLSGTPSAAGSFSFIIQVTDAVNRTVSLNYSITIH